MIGLTTQEAKKRLEKYGTNTLPQARSRGLPDILGDILREPMFLLLLMASGLYLFLGSLSEGLFMVFGAGVSVGLVIFQEARSERALKALRELAEPMTTVLRDGARQSIPAAHLVPGDAVLLGEGDRIPADMYLASGDVLKVDESVLTGESVPVEKIPRPDSSRDNTLLSGSMVVQGQGVGFVLRTGDLSEMGRIGSLVAGIEAEQTPLQKSMARVIARFGGIAILFCALVAVAYGFIRQDWSGGILNGLTLAIGLLPEEFPMVLAIFMALGAWRLGRHRVLVRRSAVIETLGAVSVLCVDKTGTITENHMSVTEVFGDDRVGILRAALMASAPHPTDPMDRAVHEALPADDVVSAGVLLKTYPLSPMRMAVVQVWQVGSAAMMAAKGAPESIARLCRMGTQEQEAMLADVASMAARGLRVLAVAEAQGTHDPDSAPFVFRGLLGFLDPLKQDVRAAIAEACGAGIRVVMITGDYPATAIAIAQQAGIDISGGTMTGGEVAATPKELLADKIKNVCVFARVRPEQKLMIVEAFRALGLAVAMTGDGVNDVPALEAAHVGIAMGKRGTDIARESADIVLLDDAFSSIIGGIRLGRRIFNNLRKAMTFVTAVHVPIAGLALLPIVLGMPPLFYPMHVVFLELLVDPLCSVVFEAEPSDANAMKRRPRRIEESLFGLRQIVAAFMQGLLLMAGVFALYVYQLQYLSTEEARAAAYVALVTGNLALAFSDSIERGAAFFDTRRYGYWVIAFLGVCSVMALLFVPALANIFGFIKPDTTVLFFSILCGVVAGGWFGLAKRFLKP